MKLENLLKKSKIVLPIGHGSVLVPGIVSEEDVTLLLHVFDQDRAGGSGRVVRFISIHFGQASFVQQFVLFNDIPVIGDKV